MKRILFVDDEPRILDGLKRLLRAHRDVWDMVFVGSGEAALEALLAESFDVLVSDMKMPGMDGATLLREAQARCPDTVRIILSGQADIDVSLRTVTVSHQFLTKPCAADVLKRVIDRACNLKLLLGDPTLQRALGAIGKLPVLPKTYADLSSALAETEVDLERVGAIVERDQATAAKLLQLVNSSFFGLQREISNVRQATAYLGVNTIRSLTLSVEVFRQFDAAKNVPGFSLEREQAHALLVGRIARRLLPDKHTEDQVFLAAMLHDIGKLVLAAKLPGHLTKVLQAGAGVDKPFHVAEESVLGAGHAEIGAYLLGLWGMPYPIVEAVAYHHRPGLVEHDKTLGVLAVVHYADALACEASGSPPAARPELDLALLERLGLGSKLPQWRAIALEESDGDPLAA